MSYIGVPPVSGDFVVLDAITTSATASYTLQRSSVNFAPESANHMLVSLNGRIQKPNSSFTISGSTITFSSALTSSDVIDFILVLGNVNAVGVATTVADDAITDAKTNFVSTSSSAGLQIRGDGTTDGTLQLNCSQNSHGIKLKSPAHSAGQSYTLTFPTSAPSANKALITDGSGNLSFGSAGGITVADQWRLSTAITSPTTGADTVISSNWERNDSTGYGVLGSGMSESSGIFTFPSTGFYLVRYVLMTSSNNDHYFGGAIEVTTNNSSYSEVAEQFNYFDYTGSTVGSAIFLEHLLDVTDVSNIKVRFTYNTNNGTYINGNSSKNQTFATFVRLGDT